MTSKWRAICAIVFYVRLCLFGLLVAPNSVVTKLYGITVATGGFSEQGSPLSDHVQRGFLLALLFSLLRIGNVL